MQDRSCVKFTKQHGFTLIEVMIVVAVLLIIITVAVPGMQNMVLNNRRTSVTHDLLGSLYLARSESVKRGVTVSVCPTADNATCGNVDWDSGWILFVNDDGDQPPQVDAGETILKVDGPDGGTYTLQGSASIDRGIGFRSNGLAMAIGDITYCDSRGNADAHSVNINITGQAKLVSSGAQACP